MFNARKILNDVPDEEKYDEIICDWYHRALESQDEMVRQGAADSLFSFYLRKKEYEKAEQCLSYFSMQNPERKRKQAQIYSEMNRIKEAYQAYEELLFADYQMVNATLQGLYFLAVKENDLKKAHLFADKLSELARCFEMGRYREICNQLDISTIENDVESVHAILEEMLESVDNLNSFTQSFLYEHMQFKELSEDFLEELKNNLMKCKIN